MLLKEFADRLNTFFSVELVKDHCPNGVQIEGRKEITKCATAVSANLQTLQQAAQEGVDLLIVHHGLFWNGDPYPLIGAKYKKILLLLEKQISLLAYHLPLDSHREVGNNWKAASDLGWERTEPFGLYNGTYIGVKGIFPEKSIDAFVKELEKYYQHPAICALHGKKNVQSAALISGGAYRQLSEAAQAGVDCFITGNVDEPAWGMAYETEMNFISMGHSATERVGPRTLADHITREFCIPCHFIDVYNPF